MKIAEFFVLLGVKGDDKTKKAMKDTSRGLDDVKGMALETKAAILGVMYGLQQLMAKSGQAGRDLQQFAAATGLSAETLQKWQYAGRQFNLGADEVMASVKGVQDAMTNMLLSGEAPAGMDLMAGIVGDFDYSKIRDTFYVMQKYQEAIQKMPPDASRKLFGPLLGEGMVAAMHKNAFNPEAFAKANIYSDRESESLRKVEVGWLNLGDKIQKTIGHLNAKHGGQLLGDIDKITTQVLKLVEQLIMLAEKLKVFEWIGKAFEGWNMILKGINGNLGEVNGKVGGKGAPTAAGGGSSFFSDIRDMWKGMQIVSAEENQAYQKQLAAEYDAKLKGTSGAPSNNNVTINQNMNIQGHANDPGSVRRAAEKGASHAIRSSTAVSGGF